MDKIGIIVTSTTTRLEIPSSQCSFLMSINFKINQPITQVKFQSQSTQLSSKYEGLPTARLVALAHSKYQDLLNSCAEETGPILVSFIELSGICNPFGDVLLPGLTDTVDAPCSLVRHSPSASSSANPVLSLVRSHCPSQSRRLTTLHILENSSTPFCRSRRRE